MRPRIAALAVLVGCSMFLAAASATGATGAPSGAFSATGATGASSGAFSATGATRASPAGSPGVRLNVLSAVGRVLARVERTAAVAIRIPRTVYVFARTRVYATASVSAAAYDLELGFGPGCAGATVCFAASFSGRRGATASGRQVVRLTGGIVGRFSPSSCGASCAPPEIQWVQQGVCYTLQLYGRLGSDLRTLIGYADSAIAHPGL